ncbi:MAG TPA: hypothetical protein VGU66_16485 [Candidatus Elarobacter sp.]|nr:hypothetical protein [Candidatus Elarobacter sp.]
MHGDGIVAIFVFMFLFGFPVAAFIVARVLRHHERIEMLRRGIVPPFEFDKRAYRAWRRTGAPWPPGPGGPGPAQAPWPQPAPATWQQQRVDDDPQCALHKGIRIAAVGLALVIGLSFIGGTPGSPDFRGGPWLLAGLIPMFVGIAQILIAVLSGAQLPGVQGRTTLIPPPPYPPPGPGAPPPQPPPGYGAQPPTPPPWAQRSPFEELSKPVQPPDLR